MARGAAEMASALIDNSRLPLLFDLDETLLSASTSNNLRVKIKNLREKLAVLKQQKDARCFGLLHVFVALFRLHSASCLTYCLDEPL